MTTLTTRLTDLATRIATETKSIRTLVNGNTADLSALSTTAKSSLVAALNELKGEIDSVSSSVGAQIDDASSSSSKTWSSTKIAEQLSSQITAAINTLEGGAGSAVDTLKKLGDLISADEGGIASLVTSLTTKLDFGGAQTLTLAQQAQGRANLDAFGSVEIGTPDTNFVTVFQNGLT
jgi:hypothetical protein